MITIELARGLADAGVLWQPTAGDRFVVDEPSLHEQVFWISELVVELQTGFGQPLLGFNGTTEWALDSVNLDQTLWLPREDQLRDLLGDRFVALQREDDAWVVTIRTDAGDGGIELDAAGRGPARTLRFANADCECAYAAAVLAIT